MLKIFFFSLGVKYSENVQHGTSQLEIYYKNSLVFFFQPSQGKSSRFYNAHAPKTITLKSGQKNV